MKGRQNCTDQNILAPRRRPDRNGVRLPPIAEDIQRYNVLADKVSWAISDTRKWPDVDAARLSPDHISALRFITYIEDHIPGYFAEYQRLFPLEPDMPEAEFVFNREMFRFISRWTQEEERHANALFQYQVHAGLAGPEPLRGELAGEGVKPFHLTVSDSLAAIFGYTLVQEKATQLFYSKYAAVLNEPLLCDILATMAKDETRHFAFFRKMLRHCLEADFRRSTLELKDMLSTFKMPLAETLKGYWRWSIRICDATGYRHSDAFPELLRVVRGFANARSDSKTREVEDLLRQLELAGA